MSIYRKYISNKIHNLILKEEYVYVYNKSHTVLSDYIDKSIYIYNGKTFELVIITEEMVGYKFGEFVSTRQKFKFVKKKKKK